MTLLNFSDKNNFVVAHTSAKYFEKDAKLFRVTLPTSRLIIELGRANQFNKEKLDGRMLMEMLNFITPEKILKNRGVLKKKKAPTTPAVVLDPLKVEDLLSVDAKSLDYNKELKPLVKHLKLITKDKSKDALLAALRVYKESITDADNVESGPSVDDSKASDSGTDNTPVIDAEKADELLSKDAKSLVLKTELLPLGMWLKLGCGDGNSDTLVAALNEYKQKTFRGLGSKLLLAAFKAAAEAGANEAAKEAAVNSFKPEVIAEAASKGALIYIAEAIKTAEKSNIKAPTISDNDMIKIVADASESAYNNKMEGILAKETKTLDYDQELWPLVNYLDLTYENREKPTLVGAVEEYKNNKLLEENADPAKSTPIEGKGSDKKKEGQE